MDIQKLLEQKLKEGSQREMGLTDRLNYLDNYNKDVAVPQISSEGPKGYNPVNSLNSLFQMISNRKAVSNDVTNQSNSNLDVISQLAKYEKDNKPKAIDPLEILKLKIEAKKAGIDFDPETLEISEDGGMPKEKKQLVTDIDEVLSRDLGAATGIPNLFKISENITTKAKVDQIKAKLSLEQRQLLKGSGQISDKEQQMLADSVAALNYKMSNKDFRAEIEKIRGILTGEYGGENAEVGGFTIKEIK